MRITHIPDYLKILGEVEHRYGDIYEEQFISIEIDKDKLTQGLDVSMVIDSRGVYCYVLRFQFAHYSRSCTSESLELINYIIECIKSDKDVTEKQCKLDLSEYFI